MSEGIATTQMSLVKAANPHNQQELWSIKTVSLKTGLSRASIYRYSAYHLFPARRRIGPGRVAWLASDVLAWMETAPEQLREMDE